VICIFSHHKKWNYVVCRQIDGTGEHHVKQSKPGSETQRSHVFSNMWKIDPKGKCIQDINMIIYTNDTFICIYIFSCL
jgi:hypothetical protein